MSKADFSFIRYSNCWEDTRILLEALDIRRGETGISIASAGDNTLAMLINEPERIYAFDVNPTQLYCCELKMACFRCLSYKETLTLLGVLRGERLPLYSKVRAYLSEEALMYFDSNPDIISGGIIHCGKFERFFRIFRERIIPLISTRKDYRTFARMDDMEEQRRFYDTRINNRRMKAIFSIYFGYKVMGRLGRDSSFYDHVDEKEQSGNDIRGRFEFGVYNTLNADNPYINYIVCGGYAPRSLPLYLHRENYDIIRRNLDRITLIHGDLSAIPTENIDFANLSDIFEYMSDEEFSESKLLLSRMLSANGRVAYWNMQNRRYPDDILTCDTELSERLFRKNNSWFYRDFRLYRKADKHEQDS